MNSPPDAKRNALKQIKECLIEKYSDSILLSLNDKDLSFKIPSNTIIEQETINNLIGDNITYFLSSSGWIIFHEKRGP